MAKDEKLLIDFIESMQIAKEVTNSNSTDVVEISNEFLKQRMKFLAWKQSKKFPAIIRLGIDKKINERILYTPQTLNPYFLPDVEIGSVMKFWSCEKNGQRNFLLYEFKVNDFNEDEIVAQISDFFAIGLNIFKQSEERCTIKVCDGTPDDVQCQVKESKLMKNKSISAYENFLKMTVLAIIFAHVRKIILQKHLHTFMSVLIIIPMVWGIGLRTLVKNEKANTVVTQDNIPSEISKASFPEANNPVPPLLNYSSDKDLQAVNVEASYDLGSSGNKGGKLEKSSSREILTVKEKAKSNNSIEKATEDLLCQQLQETTKKIQENQSQLESVNREIAVNRTVSEQEQLKVKKQKLENDKSQLLKNFLTAVKAINSQDKNSQINPQITIGSQENVIVSENMLEISNLNEEDSYEELYDRNNCVKYNTNSESKMGCLGSQSIEDEK